MTDALHDATNAAAAEAEWRELQRADALERGRNVDKAIGDFIATLKEYHYGLLRRDVSASTGLNINQVTEGELKPSVEDAYKKAKLYEFEQFAGELWTRDRLTVRIIDQAKKGLQPYFTGVGAKGPGMPEINDLFARSAVEVYSAALEVAEIVGVSLSFDRFIRTIYEYSDQTDERMWAPGADGRYEKLATALIDQAPRERFIQDGPSLASDPLGLQRQFQYRFRARRALYDCLSSHYPDMIKTSGGKSIEASYSASKGIGVEAAAADKTKPAKTVVATGEPHLTAASLDANNAVWIKAGSFMDSYCKASTLAVANEATTGNIHPVSSRSDTSASDNPAAGATTLPASLTELPK